MSIGGHEYDGGIGAAYAVFGGGCAGRAGVPTNTAGATPRLGTSLQITFGNLPSPYAGSMVLGASRTTSSMGALPIHLAFLNAPGCMVRASLEVPRSFSGAAGSASVTFQVPNQTSLLGVEVYTQALVLDPGRNGLGAVMSDAAVLTLGI